MKRSLSRSILTLTAVVSAAFLLALNKKTFIDTAGLYPGGVAGLTILVQRLTAAVFAVDLPFTPVNLLLNVVPVWIGFRFIGRNFTLFSCVMIV